jgi:hypothetical protein
MKFHHEAWAIVNNATGNVIAIEDKFYIFSEEGKAWEECLRLRGLNPTHEFSVRKTKIMLPWK